jgi:hypothetical protein
MEKKEFKTLKRIRKDKDYKLTFIDRIKAHNKADKADIKKL